jgi:hypothetical protein
MKLQTSVKVILFIVVAIVAICALLLFTPRTAPNSETHNRAKTEKPKTASDARGTSSLADKSSTPVAGKPTPSAAPVLTIAKLTLPLAFADTGSDPQLRHTVANDLQLVYGHLDGHEVVSAGTVPPVMVQGHAITPTKLINFTGPGRYFPRALDGEIGYVGNVEGRETLLINDKIVAAYREAIERRAVHPIAYRAIDNFVDELNHLEREPLEDPNQMFVTDPAVSREFSQVGAQAFARQFVGRKYRAPSLLEIVDGAQVNERYKGRLVAKLYTMTRDGLEDSMPPIMFDQGRWKFLIVPPP